MKPNMAIGYGSISLGLPTITYGLEMMRSLWYVDLYIIGIEFSPRELLFIFEHLLLHRNECY